MCLNDFRLIENVVFFIFANLIMFSFVFMIILICKAFLLIIFNGLLLMMLIIKNDLFFIVRINGHSVVTLFLMTCIINIVKDFFHTWVLGNSE